MQKGSAQAVGWSHEALMRSVAMRVWILESKAHLLAISHGSTAKCEIENGYQWLPEEMFCLLEVELLLCKDCFL